MESESSLTINHLPRRQSSWQANELPILRTVFASWAKYAQRRAIVAAIADRNYSCAKQFFKN
jgi:hypothetical protein